MYCRKCGNKMGDSEKFCTRCGTKVEPTDINTPAPQMFMYNDINKNINNNASDGELIRAYIGSKENKMYYKAISKKGFNIWAYLFGAVYYAYRKLYVASLIIIIINILIIYVLKLNYLLAFVNILYACLFYKIYGTHIEKEVDRSLLRKALETLSEREQTIIRLRFGIDDKLGQELTQKEVADLLGISQSYISRLEKKIMKRLKKEILRLEGR